MVADIPLTPELRVLVAQGVQGMGVAGDDAVERARLKRLDVLRGEELEQALLADAADVVAGVALAVVEDPEIHRRRFAGAGRRRA